MYIPIHIKYFYYCLYISGRGYTDWGFSCFFLTCKANARL